MMPLAEITEQSAALARPSPTLGPLAATVPARFDFVVFGGTGDLAIRKLLPALYQRERDGQLPVDVRVILISRAPTENLAGMMNEQVRRHVPDAHFDPATWERFGARLSHLVVDGRGDHGWEDLAKALAGRDDGVRIFYLATAHDLFGPISAHLAAHGLVTPLSRVVLEKPLGHDLASANAVNDAVGAVFGEKQIFRIDHYLGKETVQNLLALRFANILFESLWQSAGIDHVQITVAEELGVRGRGDYYDHSGALRDMMQNHLLQLLCLVAMEPPVKIGDDEVRNEKLKVLRALKPLRGTAVEECTVRGQYRAGAVRGVAVPGYLDDIGTESPSDTETFVALKAEVRNWRWAGVPFYLRTGKRMPDRASEIIIQFRSVPHSIFPEDAGRIQANRLILRLQPDEGIRLLLMNKDPGPGGLRLRPMSLNLSFADAFKTRFPDAYERLLMDVVRGNATLFMRRDEVEAAWSWIEPILEGWDASRQPPKPYPAGSWGPNAAIALIERDGRTWHEEGLA